MLVQNISPVNYAGNQSFSGKSKTVENVVYTAFEKVRAAKSKNLDCFIGTSKGGDNIVIRETLFGKAADLFVSFSDKAKEMGAKDFEIYHLTKGNGKTPKITTDDAQKLPAGDAKYVENILDTLV